MLYSKLNRIFINNLTIINNGILTKVSTNKLFGVKFHTASETLNVHCNLLRDTICIVRCSELFIGNFDDWNRYQVFDMLNFLNAGGQENVKRNNQKI